MKRHLIILCLLLGVFLLQWFFSSQINILRIQPDFLLVAVVFLSFYVNFKRSLVISFVAGFLKDSFTAGIFGANIFSFLLVALLLEQYKHYVYREDLYLKIILVFLASTVCGFLNYLIILPRFPASFFVSLFLVILPESLYTTLLAPLLFWLMRRCVLKYSI